MAGAVSDQVKVKKAAVKSAPKVLETELGIKYIELKKGSGAFPTPNDFVIINYRYQYCHHHSLFISAKHFMKYATLLRGKYQENEKIASCN